MTAAQEYHRLQPLIMKLCRACDNVEFLVVASVVEIINLGSHVNQSAANHRVSMIVKIFEACANIEYYVWEKVRHLLDIQKETVNEDGTIKRAAPELPFMLEALLSCKNVNFYVWNEVERHVSLEDGKKNVVGHSVISETTFKQRVFDQGSDNHMVAGHLNHGANARKVNSLLAACQNVDLDVYLDAKEKFGEVGAKWNIGELTKVGRCRLCLVK